MVDFVEKTNTFLRTDLRLSILASCTLKIENVAVKFPFSATLTTQPCCKRLRILDIQKAVRNSLAAGTSPGPPWQSLQRSPKPPAGKGEEATSQLGRADGKER